MSQVVPPAASVDALLAHASWARRLALSLVRDHDAAEDLVQAAWEVALRSRPDANRPVRPWLGTVLRNLFRMRHRATARRQAREEAAHAEAPAEVAPSSERLVLELEQQRLLSDLVLSLDEPFRTTLLSRFYEGLSAAEIAEREGVPAGTVRWRLKEGLDRLRRMLDQRHQGDRRSWQLALTPLTDPLGVGPSLPPSLVAKGVAMKFLVASALVGAGAAATVAVTHTAPPPRVATPAPAPVATPHAPRLAPASKLGRLDASSRQSLLQSITRAQRSTRPGTAPPRDLDREYIAEQMKELLPLVKECFEAGLERQPGLAGKILLRFTIVGQEGIGGLVSDSQVVDEKSSLKDAAVRECIQESMYAAQFPAPAGGGQTVVEYPFVLMPDDSDDGE